jgi:hypothetical protein
MMGVGYKGKKAMANADDVQMYDAFYDRATFEYMWCIWPRKCYNSGKWIIADIAVRGRRVITGPGDPVIEDRWYCQDEALMMFLKKE